MPASSASIVARSAVVTVAVLTWPLLAMAVSGAGETDLRAGEALFVREWVPGDPRSAAGAGLGPDANGSSCVSCHSQGGVGGAGGRAHNVGTQGDFADVFGGMQAMMVPVELQAGRTAVFGTGRNPPALFGAGLIDRVPSQTLEALASVKHTEHPAISGRVSKTGDGRVGRFAWKGHVSSLSDFVSQACEVELGLVVERPGSETTVLAPDLVASQVSALTAFVGALSPPVQTPDQPFAKRGAAVFDAVGCAACHVQDVGAAVGVYSDLLLHDMGPTLTDAGLGYAEVAPSELVAAAQEWRTPPLWGVRDSAPYLHDGRADTLRDAIAQHGGEAGTVVAAWRALPEDDRVALESFLRSLAAPTSSVAWHTLDATGAVSLQE